MKHYILATQQPWGVKAFYSLPYDNGQWTMVCSEGWLALAIEQTKARYAFFLNWSAIVSPDVLRTTECVNFHSFGPVAGVWFRGGGPIEGLLLRGYTETMIWAHRMTPDVDAGPVYGSRGPLSLAGTKEQILDRFVEPVVDLVKWIVNTEPDPVPQVGEVVTFKRLPKAEYEAFWKARA